MPSFKGIKEVTKTKKLTDMVIMKFCLFIIILLNLSSCTSKKARQTSSISQVNIILDIDYTIVSPVEGLNSREVITLESGENFRVNNYVREFIQEMQKNERVNIYFFSGGKKERNLELLSKIKIESGQSLLDISLDIYSFDDLLQVSEIGKFSQKYKKDLKALGFNMNNTILIDDVQAFSPVDQINNMLWTGKAYYHFEHYSDVITARANPKLEQQYIPKSPKDWLWSKNIFLNIKELFIDILSSPSSTENVVELIQLAKTKHLHQPKKNINCLSLPLEFP